MPGIKQPEGTFGLHARENFPVKLSNTLRWWESRELSNNLSEQSNSEGGLDNFSICTVGLSHGMVGLSRHLLTFLNMISTLSLKVIPGAYCRPALYQKLPYKAPFWVAGD